MCLHFQIVPEKLFNINKMQKDFSPSAFSSLKMQNSIPCTSAEMVPRPRLSDFLPFYPAAAAAAAAAKSLSRVWLCVTPETAAQQAPPSLGFSRQESEKWKGSRLVMFDSIVTPWTAAH